MKRLNLTIIDLGALTEGVNKFVKWWVEMEIYIKDVETKGSGLRPGRDRARVKQVRKIWSDIKRDYLEYKTKVCYHINLAKTICGSDHIADYPSTRSLPIAGLSQRRHVINEYNHGILI